MGRRYLLRRSRARKENACDVSRGVYVRRVRTHTRRVDVWACAKRTTQADHERAPTRCGHASRDHVVSFVRSLGRPHHDRPRIPLPFPFPPNGGSIGRTSDGRERSNRVREREREMKVTVRMANSGRDEKRKVQAMQWFPIRLSLSLSLGRRHIEREFNKYKLNPPTSTPKAADFGLCPFFFAVKDMHPTYIECCDDDSS